MLAQEKIIIFLEAVKQSLDQNTFVKISFGNYLGNEESLKNIIAKKISIQEEEKLSFTFRYKTKDIIKNHSVGEAITLVESFLKTGFQTATLFTNLLDVQIECLKNGKSVIRNLKPAHTNIPSIEHDRNKKRHITSDGRSYLYDLDITNKDGQVLKHGQDKFKQINHYIELLSPMLKELKAAENFEVADMGSGKGYLTFALYDYLVNTLHVNATVTGVEFRDDMVKLCNEIAVKNKFTQLHFVKSDIVNYDVKRLNMLIALHACDTATDEAIYKGIEANADIIVVAPCCHKQIRKEIEKYKQENDLDFVIKHGIFMERQAEMLTDSIRALLMEYNGYKVKVFEFISEAHTPKNVMIVGVKNNISEIEKSKILSKLNSAKNYFGIKTHHLQSLLEKGGA